MHKAITAMTSLGSATHAAKRTADVIFVLQNKERHDPDVLIGQLNEVLKAYGEHDSKVTQAELDDLVSVSRKMHMVFVSQDVEHTATLLNAILAEYAYAPRLSSHGNSPWHLHIDSNDHAPWAEWFAASSAHALAMLLAEKQRNPGGLCASQACGRPFIDLGKGGGRSYCSPKCATRERVATYRSKARQAQ